MFLNGRGKNYRNYRGTAGVDKETGENFFRTSSSFCFAASAAIVALAISSEEYRPLSLQSLWYRMKYEDDLDRPQRAEWPWFFLGTPKQREHIPILLV